MINHSFGVIHHSFGMINQSFGVTHHAFGMINQSFGVTHHAFGMINQSFGVTHHAFGMSYNSITYILTAIVVPFLPSLILHIDFLINPPIETRGGRCGMPLLAFYIANFIFLLPIIQGLQFIFNVWLFKLLKKGILESNNP
ncbi:MAG: hypothetical protein ACYDCN_07945 [Bacteroidia bacterium]